MNENVNSIPTPLKGAGSMNDALDQLDNLLGRLGLMPAGETFSILYLMDAITAQINELGRQGVSLKAEINQFQGSCASLKKQAKLFLSQIGGVSALVAEREKRNPPPEAWWWFLDNYLTRERNASLKRFGVGTAIVLGVLFVLALVYHFFLTPSPALIARMDARDHAERLVADKKYDDALAAIQKGLTFGANDIDLLSLKGYILTLQGKDQQAADAFDALRANSLGLEDYFLTRSQTALTIGQPRFALQDAKAAIQVNPNSAQGFLMLGSAQEFLNDRLSALESYQKAADLGNAQGDTTIVAQAKIKYAYLLQQLNFQGESSPTP